MLVKKYHDTHCEDKEVLITNHKAIDASPELRSKKQGVIDTLKTFFETYFGIGGSSSFTKQEHKVVTYDSDRQETLSMVAELKTLYGEKSFSLICQEQ